jgi:FxsC-like protein
VTVAAPDRSNLPSGRDGFYYGETPRDWNPYRPESVRPIAEFAADLARSLGYRPKVGSLTEHAGELLGHAPPAGPAVMFVDPWAVTVPEILRVLQEIDKADDPWVSVVVPWNAKDQEIEMEAEMLRRRLQAAMPRKLSEVSAASLIAVSGVPSIEDFAMVVPVVMRTADRQYMKHSPVVPTHSPADG